MSRGAKCLLLISILFLPASAQAADMGLKGWGPRLGVADDPDQIIGGVHWNSGELVRHLRLQPNIEVGLGDDATVVSGTLPLHYRFRDKPALTPYVGIGVLFAYVDRDDRRPGKDDSEFEINPVLIWGLEWPLSGGGDIFFEVDFTTGDAHEIKVVVGWMLRVR